MMQIVRLQMKGVGKLLEEQNIGFSFTEATVKEVVRSGFDPIFGARPLRRAIQRLVENPISGLIIESKLLPSDVVVVDFDGENFIFNVEKTELVAADSLQVAGPQKFFCEACAKDFETEVLKTATTVCPFCTSKNVVLKSTQTGNVEEVKKDETPTTPTDQPVEPQPAKENPIPEVSSTPLDTKTDQQTAMPTAVASA